MSDVVKNAGAAVNDSFLSKLLKGAADLASLDVLTLTGAIELKPGGTAVELDPTKLYEALKGAVESEKSTLRVVALTHKDVDHDATVFIAESLSDADAKLVEAHRPMVALAEQARSDTVKLLASLAGIKLG